MQNCFCKSLFLDDFRWIKFEEDVEEGGDRWSKPFVATLSLHSLFELRKSILSGTVMLDVEANSLMQTFGKYNYGQVSCNIIA